MGILNITPDSFYAESRLSNEKEVLKTAGRMLAEGAGILDIGAYSSRPGAINISEQEESDRLLPPLRALAKEFPEAVISVDTFRSEIARAAIGEGATMINDISGGQLDTLMFSTVAGLHVPYILMHMKGTPQTMQQENQYDDLMGEILVYFMEKISLLKEAGVKDVIIDPGFGFAKNSSQNFQLLHHLDQLQVLNQPVLAGLSRKSLVYKSLEVSPEEALNGTAVLNTIALLKGVSILRVHDVKEAAEAVKLVSKMTIDN